MVFVSRPGHAVSLFWGFFFSRCQRSSMSTISTSLAKPPLSYQNLIRRPLPARGSAPWEGFWNYNNNDNNNNNNNDNNNSNLFAKPCCSLAAEVSFLNGFLDAERRNLLVHGIAASRYRSHVQTVGLWVWRNQNVTETWGFYSGFKRNVWHQRWAKCGLKMVFVSRPGHAVSPFWRVFFQVPEVFHVHNFHKPAKTSIIASKPYNFLVHSNGFFDDERRNQLFHGIWAARYWNHVKTVGLRAWRNQNVTKTLGFYGGFKRNVWHRRWAKGGLKMVFVSRPGHAVSPFWGFFFQGARGLPCPQLPQACQNQHYRIKTL